MICPNGRVNLLNTQSNQSNQLNQLNQLNQFNLMDKIPLNNKSTSYCDALNGNLEISTLSNTYFNSKNIQTIQNAIKKAIYDKSQKVIDNQNENELKIIMRSMYLQWSNNSENNITKQVEALNKLVVDYCVKTIYSELIGYYKYCEAASTLAVPLDMPILSNMKNKTLEQKPWF